MISKKGQIVKFVGFVILLIVGLSSASIGAEKILFPEPFGELDLSELSKMKTPLEVSSKVYPNLFLTLDNGTKVPTAIRTLNLDLESEYIFVANNPIHITATAILREPESVKEMYLITNSPNIEVPSKIINLINWADFIDYENRLNATLKFQKQNFLTFTLDKSKVIQLETDISFYIVLKKSNDEIEIIPLDNNKTNIHVRSPLDYLQVINTRYSLSEMFVTQDATKTQHRSNEVMEGLSYLVLSAITLDPAYRIYNSIFSSNIRLR